MSDTPLYDLATMVGSVFQNPKSQFFNVDTDSELAFACENLGYPKENILQRITKTVSDYHIKDLMGRSVFALSGGEKQKIACASSSVLLPGIMVLDEPSSNLDVAAIDDLRRVLTTWKEQGKTILIAEHRLYYLRNLIDRVLYINEGEIKHEYTPAEFEMLPDAQRKELGLRPFSLSKLTPSNPYLPHTSKQIEFQDFCFSYKKREPERLHIPNVKLPVGETIAIIGLNGAGKSTLIKILSGAYAREEGTVILDGNEMPPMPPGEVIKAGVSVIYQEFNLVPEMSVYENIFLGKEIVKGGRVDHKKEIEEAKKCMDRVGLDCSPKTLISELSVAKKQLVEIAKAISNDVKILVLDEPTAAITDKETEMLFNIIRELKKQGIGIIYISHRLSELLEIGDVCTVMRDGEYIDTVNIKDATEDELTRLMVGRQVSFEKLENPHLKKDEVVLSVTNLNYKNLVRNVSFDLHKGEILGFAGLVGAGRTETAKTIIGDYKKDSGTVIYKGKEIGTNLSENIKNGIVYLSEDRKDEGLILMHSVAENIALPNLPKLCKPFLNRRKERSVSKDYIKSLKIKTFSELTDAKNLSGGNQQKVVIAKWLYSDADIYIFDEPTRGIDVGARDEIYNIMYDMIAKGASIIMISSDLVEVLKMSDRVVVMREGRINGIVENDGMLTQEETMKMELAEEEKHEG